MDKPYHQEQRENSMSGVPQKQDRVKRIVRRKGKLVEIIHTIGDYTSKPIFYEFRSYAKAREFEKEITRVDGEFPVTIPFEYRDYLMEEVEEPKPEQPPEPTPP
jgi:hypothetical protein